MTPLPPRLALSGLVRRFPGVTALAGVSLSAAAGEVVALLGENGAGKSTLVEVIGGGLRPDGGTLELDGEPYRPLDPLDAQRARVSVVHQHFQLVEAFTVGENLRLAMKEGSLAKWEEMQLRLGLPLPPLEARVAALGVGERQRLEIGKALLSQPRLLLLDEPTAVLTPAEADALFNAVRRLAAEGTTVLFITHRLDEVRRVADGVVVLRRGQVVDRLPATAEARRLAEAMTGELPRSAERKKGALGDVVARLFSVALPPQLEPLDLELRMGEIVVLAGVDGNGQAAAAERLAGLSDGPGEIEVDGVRLSSPTPSQLRRLGVWVIPGDRTREGLAPSLSVAENLILGRHRHGAWRRGPLLEPAAVRVEGERLVAEFGVVGDAVQAVSQLSGGNQQKVIVARAVSARPRVLVAIHPTRGLDVTAAATVRAQLAVAAAAGAGVLVVTADLEEAVETADRILVLSRGRVVGEGGRGTSLGRLARWVGGEAA